MSSKTLTSIMLRCNLHAMHTSVTLLFNNSRHSKTLTSIMLRSNLRAMHTFVTLLLNNSRHSDTIPAPDPILASICEAMAPKRSDNILSLVYDQTSLSSGTVQCQQAFLPNRNSQKALTTRQGLQESRGQVPYTIPSCTQYTHNHIVSRAQRTRMPRKAWRTCTGE